MSDAIAPRPSLTKVAFSPSREITFSTWRAYGQRFAAIERASRWWIGDWLNYGEAAYGERYTKAVEITGYSVGDLMDMAWVASVYEISDRSEVLSWSHHRDAASLDPAERREVLRDAEEGAWSRRQLQAEVKRRRRAEKVAVIPQESGHNSGHNSDHEPPRVELVVASERGERWLRACVRVLEEHGAEFGLRVERAEIDA